MTIAEKLSQALSQGIRFIGQIQMTRLDSGEIELRHLEDADMPSSSLENHHGPQAARDISTWAEDGHYRFTKGELSLRRGWCMILRNPEDLRSALESFYPAAIGLWIAQQENRLEVQNLRDKLHRQTGMYRFARNISNAGAQQLVRETCGPAHCCVKKILWQIDSETPLEPSEASRYPGHLPETAPSETIPLLCREACNHFVAECRKISRKEHEAANASS